MLLFFSSIFPSCSYKRLLFLLYEGTSLSRDRLRAVVYRDYWGLYQKTLRYTKSQFISSHCLVGLGELISLTKLWVIVLLRVLEGSSECFILIMLVSGLWTAVWVKLSVPSGLCGEFFLFVLRTCEEAGLWLRVHSFSLPLHLPVFHPPTTDRNTFTSCFCIFTEFIYANTGQCDNISFLFILFIKGNEWFKRAF